MKKTLLLLATLAAISTGCSNVNQNIGSVNGVTLSRVTTRGFFSPSTTTVIAYDTNRPGTLLPISSANGPGALQAVAQPASIAAGAYLLKPSTTKVNNGTGDAGDVTVTTGGVNNSTGGHVHNNTHSHN